MPGAALRSRSGLDGAVAQIIAIILDQIERNAPAIREHWAPLEVGLIEMRGRDFAGWPATRCRTCFLINFPSACGEPLGCANRTTGHDMKPTRQAPNRLTDDEFQRLGRA
jgi:hypothetical protein